MTHLIGFARGGGAKAAPKGKTSNPLADVASAIGGSGGCGTGTQNGKKGFQPGNKCAHKGNRNPDVLAKQKAHTAASAHARKLGKKHVAGTAPSREYRAAIKAARDAGAALRSAREAHAAGKKVAKNAARREARAAAKATTTPKAAAPETPKVAAKADPKVAAKATLDAAAAKARADRGEPSPAMKARVEKSVSEAATIKATMAHQNLADARAGLESGRLDAATFQKHIDRIARGATKDDLFAAAKAAGIEHTATTKVALVAHLKANAPKPAATAPSLPEFAAKVQAAAASAPMVGSGPAPKAFIAHVHDALRSDPHIGKMSREEFGQKLVEAHRARLLELGRGDLFADASHKTAMASATPHMGAEYHYVRVPDAAAKAPAKAAKDAPKAEPAPTTAPATKAPKAKATPEKVTAGSHAADFRKGLEKATGGEIDDRRVTPEQLARHSGLSEHQVHEVARELGRKGALTFDHATPADVAMAKGTKTFPLDHEGKPYHGFRVERPAKFEAAVADAAKVAPAKAPAKEAAPVAKAAPKAIPNTDTKQPKYQEQAKHVAALHEETASRLAADVGMTPKAYRDAVTQRVKEAVDAGDHYIRADVRNVETILGEGRFKSQFETNTSGGDLDPKARADAESRLFGTPAKVAPEQRPIYGFVAAKDFKTADHESQARVAGYGEAVFKLKPEVRDRATVTVGDSLANHDRMGASPATAVTSAAVPLDSSLWKRHHADFVGKDMTPEDRLGHLATYHSYVEAQYHGGISHHDIAEVAFPSEPHEGIKAQLKRHGIPYRVRPTDMPWGGGF